MSNGIFKCAVTAVALLFAGGSATTAEAGSNARKQRGGSGQMMRLGGPTNAAKASDRFVDRTGGPTLRTNAQIERFFQQGRDSRGPG